MLRLLVIVGLVGCGSNPPPAVPGDYAAADLAPAVEDLLVAAENESCAVCVRDKQTEALDAANAVYVPGSRIRASAARGFVVLPGGAQELVFEDVDPYAARVIFRLHSNGQHLAGIDPADFSDAATLREVFDGRQRPLHAAVLEVVPFAYGDGPGISLDRDYGRITVHCRWVDDTVEPR